MMIHGWFMEQQSHYFQEQSHYFFTILKKRTILQNPRISRISKKNECSHYFQHSEGRQLIRKTPAENALQNPRAFFQFFNEMTGFQHTPRYKWIVVPRPDRIGWMLVERSMENYGCTQVWGISGTFWKLRDPDQSGTLEKNSSL